MKFSNIVESTAPSFTLEQLAHFNRTLFPSDFERDLIQEGIEDDDAFIYARYIKYNRECGILGLYQEFITDTELHGAINRIITKFVSKFHTF
jgi:nicotinamide riboside kinase